MLLVLHPYQETGKTFCMQISTTRNYSVFFQCCWFCTHTRKLARLFACRSQQQGIILFSFSVAGSAPIPGNWQDFLRVDLNKKELFCFLSKALVELFRLDKQLVVTNADQILCVPQQDDIHLIAPCNHEEADSCMLHMLYSMATIKSQFVALIQMLWYWQ